MPADQRLILFNQGGTENDLMTTFFQFGRYLLISSSRPGTVAANLQGLWNHLIQPPWGSNYTVNINTEMNYWPAEVTNLSECHEPLFNLIEKLAFNGAKTAGINYGARGWVAHHNSDIWGQTAATGGFTWDTQTNRPFWSCWPMGGGLLCQHLWKHYEFTGDKEFLKQKAWPLMRGSVLFYLDWLIEGPTGELEGFRAKGGFEIDMAWDKGEITALTIKSKIGGNCRIRVNFPMKETSKLKAASGKNPNPMFDNMGFVEPVISEELKGEAMPVKVNEVFEYDIYTRKGETIKIIN